MGLLPWLRRIHVWPARLGGLLDRSLLLVVLINLGVGIYLVARLKARCLEEGKALRD